MILAFYHYIPSKKNSKQIIYNKKTKRNIIISSEQHALWENTMKKGLLDKSIFLEEGEEKYNLSNKKGLYFSAIFFQKDKNGLFDLTNTIQSIEDLLVDEKLILDDEKKVLSHYNYSFKDEAREDNLYCIVCINENRAYMEDELIEYIEQEKNKNIVFKEIKKDYTILLEKKSDLREKQKRKKGKNKSLSLNRDLDL